MDFTPTDEQQAVAELAERICREHAAPDRLAALEAADWFDRDAWRSLADAGLLGIALPERVGGAGLGFLAVHALLEQVGATAVHAPVFETIVLGALPLAAFGDDGHDTLLRRVVAGDAVLTAALVDAGPADVLEPATEAVTDPAGGWRLTGTKTTVPVGTLADAVLVSAMLDGAPALFLVDPAADGVTVNPQTLVGDIPHAQLDLDAVHVDDGAQVGAGRGREAIGWLVDRARAGLAALQAGTCAAALALAADYTSSREQFGRAIATFQAVSQRVADAYIDTEAIRLTALQAAWLLDAGRPASDEIAIAKWWAGEAGHRVLHTAHHVHGGVGVDRDYPLHRLFGRAKTYEFTLGSCADQLGAIGRSLAAEPA